MRRTKSEYALLWANGATFGEVYDRMRLDIIDELLAGEMEYDESEIGCPPGCTSPVCSCPGNERL